MLNLKPLGSTINLNKILSVLVLKDHAELEQQYLAPCRINKAIKAAPFIKAAQLLQLSLVLRGFLNIVIFPATEESVLWLLVWWYFGCACGTYVLVILQ